MNSVSISLGIQVFVCAAVFGALINMYSVQILKTFWSTYAYGEVRKQKLPWATGNLVVQALLGKKTLRYMKNRNVLFPWFELTFASLVLLALTVHGLNWNFVRTAAFLAFALPLAMISAIDEPEAFTPDVLTIPGTVLGLVTSWLPDSMKSMSPGMLDKFSFPMELSQAIDGLASSLTGAVTGFFSLYVVYWLFFRLTGKEGMGYGCFKANMMIGAFCGPVLVFQVMIISALVGSLVGLNLIITKGRNPIIQMAFTPFQMLAGIITMTWENNLLDWWLSALGLGQK